MLGILIALPSSASGAEWLFCSAASESRRFPGEQMTMRFCLAIAGGGDRFLNGGWVGCWFECILPQDFLDALGAGAPDALVDGECLPQVRGGNVSSLRHHKNSSPRLRLDVINGTLVSWVSCFIVMTKASG
jgi:hypothetical protein